MNPSAFVHPQLQQQQHPHLQAHQKSASFGGNLYQQSTNQYAPQPGFQSPVYQFTCFSLLLINFYFFQGYQFPPRPGMTTINHNNMSTPTLQNAPSAFTHNQVDFFYDFLFHYLKFSFQLTDQFSQFVPFANSKTNTSASQLISGMPARPVTEYMPASSDLLWQ